MTTPARTYGSTHRSSFRLIIAAAILVLSLFAAGTARDAQAKQKAVPPAPDATSGAGKADAQAAGSPSQTAADSAKPAQPAPNTDANSSQNAGAKPGEQAKPEADSKASAEAAPKPPAWSAAEVADAKAHCAIVLKRIHAVALPHEPIKEGACGAPAPVELVSIGEKPQVALSPPAIVTCDLAEALTQWFENDVQPLARKHLKSEIVTIETMSSYSCRNAYGRKKTKLSEHGLANALDIGGFITATTKTAEVLEDWGKPQREILAEAEAAKRAADEAAAKTAGTGTAANPVQAALPLAVPLTAGAAAAELARSTIIEGVPASGSAKLVATSEAAVPNRLGGPVVKPGKKGALAQKAAQVALAASPAPDAEVQAFLHEAHKAACRIFGTTLGPEANADHRNHFHVDMAERKFTKICD
ncbi:extensin family protein [Hyphomicrobium sp. 2TAF46]|uniref:extensin family protein n=1 Tax=Hyphomicrobium sp. 2TAF46 TaxID=3233019 RepID=UPI003F8F3AC7